jgi:hypothetical protein
VTSSDANRKYSGLSPIYPWTFATGESAIWRKSYWRRSGNPQFELVTKLSTLLHYVCFTTSVENEMVRLMLCKPLIDKMNIFVIEFEQYCGQTKQIESISRLLHIFRRIQMMQINLYQDSLLETLFLNVSKCISSTFLMAQLLSVPKAMTDLEPKQRFLFDTCIEFMYWQPYEES